MGRLGCPRQFGWRWWLGGRPPRVYPPKMIMVVVVLYPPMVNPPKVMMVVVVVVGCRHAV